MSTYSVRGEKLKKDNKTAVEEQTAVKKDELDLQLDQQIQKAENTTGAAIDAVDANYRSAVDSAAVQRELDRRQIRETMANMGLGRSGLNATQQTAVQLSAGNKQAAAALQRQAAVDSLKQSLAEYKIASEDARRQGKLALDETAQKGIAEYDASVDKWVSEAESTEYKAQQEAATEAMKQQYKLIQDEQERVSKSNQKVLDKMLENGQLPNDMYMMASGQGWSADYLNRVMRVYEEFAPVELSEAERNTRQELVQLRDKHKHIPAFAQAFDKMIADFDETTGYGSEAQDKNEVIAKIIANFPFPDGDTPDANAVARDYLFSKAGITGDDITTFIKNNQNKTTE